MKILSLTLKREPFEVMVTGEKDFEIREKSHWINSRLFDSNGEKQYDAVKFTNGYGKDKPYFVAEYKGYGTSAGVHRTFSNGFRLDFYDAKWIINLGRIIETGNLDKLKGVNT